MPSDLQLHGLLAPVISFERTLTLFGRITHPPTLRLGLKGNRVVSSVITKVLVVQRKVDMRPQPRFLPAPDRRVRIVPEALLEEHLDFLRFYGDVALGARVAEPCVVHTRSVRGVVVGDGLAGPSDQSHRVRYAVFAVRDAAEEEGFQGEATPMMVT